MKHESMVHALEEILRLLKPGGILIDIHPVVQAWLCEVIQGGKVVLAEPSPTFDYEEDLRQAEVALAQVVQRELFEKELDGEFDFLTYAPSVAELRGYLKQASAYQESPQDEAVMARAEELAVRAEQIRQACGEGAEVAAHERARITRLRPVS
jgi:SAM-dependent methyltransferase